MAAIVEKRAVAPDLVRGRVGEFAAHAPRPTSANPMQWIGPSLHPDAVTKIRPRNESGATGEFLKVSE